MAQLPSQISVADLLLAFHHLEPDGEDRAAIAALLGFTCEERAEPAQQEDNAPADVSSKKTEKEAQAQLARSKPETSAVEHSARSIEVLSTSAEPRSSAPKWLQVQPLEPYKRQVAPEPQSLIPREWVRTRLSSALATTVVGRALDLQALIGDAVAVRPTTKLRFLSRRGLRRGVQVLVDRSAGMMPFAPDQDQVLQTLKDLFPAQKVEVCLVRNFPLGEKLRRLSPKRSRGYYRYPERGTPVLLLSDLGLGPRSVDQLGRSWEDWLAFAESVQDAGSPVVTLSPTLPLRCSRALRAAMLPIQWGVTPSEQSRSFEDIHELDELAALEKQSPAAYHLARSVCLAPLVDHALLRKARREMVKEGGAATEAKVWFSAIVATRSPRGVTFKPQFLSKLREDLAQSGELQHAWQITEETHAYFSPALRLEEEITHASLRNEPDDTLNSLLARALASLYEGTRPGLASWVEQALGRLPPRAAATQVASELNTYAQTLLALPSSQRHAAASSTTWDWTDEVLLLKGHRHCSVVLRGETLILTPGGHGPTALELPVTKPKTLVEVNWRLGEVRQRKVCALNEGRELRFPVQGDDIRIRGAGGAEWKVVVHEPTSEHGHLEGSVRKTCLVISGLGEKTDSEQQKTFDLDKSYHVITKQAVERAGFECIRCDEAIYAGSIAGSMYDRLLSADLVVADVSTNDVNTLWLLGVRHALRLSTTIVIAESKFRFPIDITHLPVHHYHHLGRGIDAEEAEWFRAKLEQLIREQTAKQNVDSPVYTSLHRVEPPHLPPETLGRKASSMQPVPDDPSSLLKAPKLLSAGSGQVEPSCFVIMGFGEKSNFEQQETFDLDKFYRLIIKKAVENAGFACIRTDDIVHAGTLDKPLFELLATADVVVADLSTLNANTVYELGVRHGLRPYSTIVIAESGVKPPIGFTHFPIRFYEHLGTGIDGEQAERFRADLTKTLQELTRHRHVDSPVYQVLPTLVSPSALAADWLGELKIQGVDFLQFCTRLQELGNMAIGERSPLVVKQSLEQFQKATGLVVDGLPGPRTLAKLDLKPLLVPS